MSRQEKLTHRVVEVLVLHIRRHLAQLGVDLIAVQLELGQGALLINITLLVLLAPVE